MTDVVVDRLRIRGTGARRLATVAARALPAALEGALADLDDGTLGPLSVTLDLNPADYDDETLALLWADRIRVAALTAGARPRGAPRTGGGAPASVAAPGPGAGSGSERVAPGPEATDSAAAVDALVALASAWLEAGAPAGTVPVALAALADRGAAAAVAVRLGLAAAARLARALEGRPARMPSRETDVQSTAPVDTPSTAAPVEVPVRGVAQAEDADARDALTAAARDADAPDALPAAEATARLAAAAAAVRPLLDIAAAADGPASSADLATATRVAGLVLLYPWLADLCRDAEAVHPRAEPVHARRLALAVLADGPDPDPALLDDPLVLFLAGAPDDASPSSALGPLDTAALAAAADAVLAGFAALLRGFERSTPAFVRASWLVRPGLLDTDTDPARLLGQTLPLDVVLHLLPYPVSLLRLPWTAPLTVRFVP